MDEATRGERLRALPAIDELLARPSVAAALAGFSRPVAVAAVRAAVAKARADILEGRSQAFDDAVVLQAIQQLGAPKLRPVLNATGVVLHTNLGRAPLAQAAVDRVAQVSCGYCNLELELSQGERGSRYEPVIELLRLLTGAEDALVVNNCAAAVLLALSALASGREAIVSRGELIEIGGGFRVPEVMRQSGATLVEVGTTNRTRLSDYRQALSPQTATVVKVHRSNFAMVGFCEDVSVKELVTLGAERGVPVLVDLGSGSLADLKGPGLPHEPTVASVVEAGADVVAFSGDKLLGGPQAGIIVGRTRWLAPLKAHPLNRALRVDKMTVAALEATLALYRDGRADEEIPTRMALLASLEVLEARARHLSSLLGDVDHRVVRADSQVGGGAMPLANPPSWAVAVHSDEVDRLHARLRQGDPAVVGRVVDGALWLDVRCLETRQLELVAHAMKVALHQV